LVAAVFDAFLQIYENRTADLVRLSTDGTGIRTGGAIHPDLVHRLCDEAAKSAQHVLTMIIRALDYLPPVDVTFFEFLRGLITADFDLVQDDRRNYRVAFIDAFRSRGIYPESDSFAPSAANPRTLSVETLRWREPERQDNPKQWATIEQRYREVAEGLKPYADECLYLTDRGERFARKIKRQKDLSDQLKQAVTEVPEFAHELGLDPRRAFTVEELRNAMRIGPDGRYMPQVLISLTQLVPSREDGHAFPFPGGSTLIIDLTVPAIKYSITKSVTNTTRKKRTAEFLAQSRTDPLHALFFRPDPRRPFAALHQLSAAL